MWKELIQVAGISSREEAWMLEELGVPLLGFPLRLDFHRPDVSESEAASIISSLKKPHTRALAITYELELAGLLDLVATTGVHGVQFHAEVDLAVVKALRQARPELYLIKSLILNRGPLLETEAQLKQFAPHVDAFITDTYDPGTGASGATGKVHDWSESARLRQLSPKPLILAGGLRAENVAAAIARVRPAGVDVHTGVENPSGAKEPALVAAFLREARVGLKGLGLAFAKGRAESAEESG